MTDEQNDMIVDPGAPDPDADPAEGQSDEHGESIHPTDGVGAPIEPPQPVNRETRVATPADLEAPPPLPAEIVSPAPLPEPPKPPSIAELTEETTIPVHECHLPLAFIKDRKALMAYVNKHEHLLNKPRRKLDVSKPPIKAGYPIFAKAAQANRQHPLTEHWYTAALILLALGVPIEDAPKADTDAILDQMTA